MGIITVLLIVIFILAAILLTIVILLQDEQGEGLGGIFGGGSSTPFGSRSGNILTKFTSILGAVFLFCTFAIAWLNRSPASGDIIGAAKRAEESQATAWWLTPVNSNAKLPLENAAASPGSAATIPAGGTPAAVPAANAPAPTAPAAGGAPAPSAGSAGTTGSSTN